MNRKIRFGGIPAGNPLANALMMIVGALAVGAAMVLGFVAFIVLGGIVLILASIVGIRLWWFSRKLRARSGVDRGQDPAAESGRIIEGEYTVVSKRKRTPPD